MQKIILGLTALLVVAALISAAPSRDTCLGNFSANMQFGKSASSKPMKFDGKLAWAKPNLRLDLTDQVTKEAMVVLVDFKGGNATLLYPDTLNGFKTKLPAMDTSGYISQFQHLLSTGGAKMEKGWTRTKVASEKVGKTAATKYKVSGPKGEQVFWWVDASDRPLKLQTGKGTSQGTLNFGDMKFGAPVPAKTFTYSKEFAIIEMAPDQAKAALPKH
jgi:outer membrane lipoprotein-sorting protein